MALFLLNPVQQQFCHCNSAVIECENRSSGLFCARSVYFSIAMRWSCFELKSVVVKSMQIFFRPWAHNPMPGFAGLLSAVLLAALLLGGCSEEGAKGKQAAGVAEVMVYTVKPESVVFTSELMGRVSPYRIAEVRPQVSGIIQERLFEEGADVKAGDILYQIDAELYKADYDNARANMAIAEANLAPVKLKMERFRGLVNVNAVSQQEYEDALAAHKQGQATVLARQAALETARIHLKNTKVTAPISGRIGRSTVTPGALITASQTQMLTTVQQLDQVYVDLTQSSAELLRLRKSLESGRLQKVDGENALVSLYLEDGTQYKRQGKLQFTDVSVDMGTGTVNLRAVFPNPELTLLPGMYVRAVLSEGRDDQALLVPQRAMVRDTAGKGRVWVVKADDTVELRPVEATRTHGDSWVISGGLAVGDRVVVEGLQRMRAGAKVVISRPPAAQNTENSAETPQF